MYERFTDRARKVMQLANQEAQRLNHEYIGTEHILLGLIKEGAGVAANVLKNLDIELRKVREEVERLVTRSLDVSPPGKLPQTPRAKKVTEYAIEEARNLNHNYVGTEHILLGLLREEEGVAAQVLMNLGLRLEDVREEVLNLLGHNMETDESKVAERRTTFRRHSKTPVLESLGVDLTARAREGRLTQVAGHAREIDEVLAVLLCRERRGALLVGDPGLGVTEVVEGLAQLLAAGDVPFELKDCRLVALELSLLFDERDGEVGNLPAEQRFKATLSEAQRGEVVLFVRDLRLLFAASAANLASLLWAAMRDRQLMLVATVTAAENERIEANAVLRDVFQAIPLQPSSSDEALATLRRLRPRLAAHHQVRITEGALEAAVTLAPRWRPGRCLTDAAAQLLDRAGALRQLRSRRQPPDMKQLDEELEQLYREKESAVSEADFEKAAHLRDRADQLKKKKEDLIRDWLHHSEEVNGVVDEQVVREAADDAAEPETPAVTPQPSLLTLESDLLREVVGQREAVAVVAGVLRRGGAGLSDPKRPLGCFLFVGPTGTGKTLLARRLAERVFGKGNSPRQIDMARFATPESGERLAENLCAYPAGVVVFDRIDRAHASVRDRLLPLLEEGILSDRDRCLDFRASVIILTTTAGSEHLLNRPCFVVGGSDPDHSRPGERVLGELGPAFGPELLARVEPVLFRGLSRDDLREVLDRELEAVTRRLVTEKGLTLKVDADARALLVDDSPPSDCGAYPLLRAVEQQVLEPLAEELLRGRLCGGAIVSVHTARAGTGRRLVFDISAPV
jgi:ATP-dependent Clp protease ATP-binding subunit ClpC